MKHIKKSGTNPNVSILNKAVYTVTTVFCLISDSLSSYIWPQHNDERQYYKNSTIRIHKHSAICHLSTVAAHERYNNHSRNVGLHISVPQ